MGYTGYCSKVVSTTVFNGETSAFASWLFYAYLIALVGAVVLQVRWLNKGLEFFPALSVVPTFQSSIIFSNSLMVSGLVAPAT